MLESILLFITLKIQSTVNGITMVNGHLAHKHVEEERNLAQEKRSWVHQTEDNHVWEKLRKLKSVMRKTAQ